MKCITLSSLLFLSLGLSPARANVCSEAVAPLRPLVAREMVVWRYGGESSFNQAVRLELSTQGGNDRYDTGRLGRASVSGGRLYTPLGYSYLGMLEYPIIRATPFEGTDGKSILEHNQVFPLQVMRSSGYLTEAEVEAQNEAARALDPAQVTFFEMTERWSEARLEEARKTRVMHAIEDDILKGVQTYLNMFEGSGDPSPRVFKVDVGASYLVSGQSGERSFRLPLDNDRLRKPIDRKRYPWIWEIGRAAQIEKHAYTDLMQAEAMLAYAELLRGGGRLEDAYLFAHTMSSDIAEYNRSRFGLVDYSDYRGRPNEKALVIPLAHALAQIGPEKFSRSVEAIWKAGTLANVDGGGVVAMRLLAEANRIKLSHASVGSVTFELRDFSRLADERRARLSPDEQITHALKQQTPFPYATRDNLHELSKSQVKLSQFPHAQPYLSEDRLPDFLRETNSIEVFPLETDGLTPSEAVLRTLFGAWVQASREVGFAWLKQAGIRFTLVTPEYELDEAARNLGPKQSWTFSRPQVRARFTRKITWAMTIHSDEVLDGISWWARSFSIEELQALARANPGVFREVLREARAVPIEDKYAIQSLYQLFP